MRQSITPIVDPPPPQVSEREREGGGEEGQTDKTDRDSLRIETDFVTGGINIMLGYKCQTSVWIQ